MGDASCMMAAMTDEISRCLLSEPTVRVVTVTTTEVSREAASRHGAVGGAAVALGRSATCALLLATLTKGGEQVTLQIHGSGPFGPLIADATDRGDVRAYIKHPAELVPGPHGQRVSVARGIGQTGTVSLVRDLGLRQPVSGQVPIVSGEVDEDVERLLTTSEQIDSALGCEVVLNRDGLAMAAGVLIQCMPDGEGVDVVMAARAALRGGALQAAMAVLPQQIDEPVGVYLVKQVLGRAGANLNTLDTRPVRYFCSCSHERILNSLSQLEDEDLRAMIEEDGGAEVICNFCRQRYQFSVAELETLRRQRAQLRQN